MKKLAITITVLLTLSVFSSVSLLNSASAETVYVDPVLSQSWPTASSSDVVDVVITLDHIPTQTDAQTFAGLSIASVPMTALPMVLVRTTYGSLSSITSYSGVVSLFQDRALTYFGQVKTVTHTAGEVPVQHSWWNDIMHVSKAWGLGFKGQGVTVAVIDTGIDATNPSLGYSFPNGPSQAPGRVIQNVKVLTVGELLSTQEQHPPLGPDQLFLENQPNSDTTGGHGTSVAGLIAGAGAVGNGIYMGAAP